MRLDILFKWLRHSAVSAYLQLQNTPGLQTQMIAVEWAYSPR
jgi:hypothetical protein